MTDVHCGATRTAPRVQKERLSFLEIVQDRLQITLGEEDTATQQMMDRTA